MAQIYPQIYADRRVHLFLPNDNKVYSTICVNLRVNLRHLREITLREINLRKHHAGSALYPTFASAATTFSCSTSSPFTVSSLSGA